MRKRVIAHTTADANWRDLESIAQVEISSEDPAHPIEHALAGESGGWRAAASGEQVVRLLFDEPLPMTLVELRFDEPAAQRTQEFVLRWSSDGGRSYRDIVRQQYTFSPPGTTSETERFTVNLSGVTALELRVIPDINGGQAIASLSRLRIA
jgi:hypothetical protein